MKSRTFIVLLMAGLFVSVAQSQPLTFLNIPDTVGCYEPETLKVAYDVGSDTLLIGLRIYNAANGNLEKLWNIWVNGTGTELFPYALYCTYMVDPVYFYAFLSPTGRWEDRNFEAATQEKPTQVITLDLSKAWSWSLQIPNSINANDTIKIKVSYIFQPKKKLLFPYLFASLVDQDGHYIARTIEWNVSNVGIFDFWWWIPQDNDITEAKLEVSIHPGGNLVNPEPLAKGSSVYFPMLNFAQTSKGRIKLEDGKVYVDNKLRLLHGVNVTQIWNTWDYATMTQELYKMAEHGINFNRIYCDWSLYETSRGVYSEEYKNRIAHFVRTADTLGIFVELVPAGNWGGWIFQMYRDHWWDCPEMVMANYEYFYEFARFCKEQSFDNIIYISAMQEGSYNFDWFDPLNGYDWGIPYPGLGSVNEAYTTWFAWLDSRFMNRITFEEADNETFGRWALEEFTKLVGLRARAIKEGSDYSYYTGLEGGQGGFQYDLIIPAKHCAYYTKVENWLHTVDIGEVHNYVDIYGTGYWSYETGLADYKDAASAFNKAVNVGEMNYTWANENIRMDDIVTAWPLLQRKLEYILNTGYIGYAIWAWCDYDSRLLGLCDRDRNPRPILDSLSDWIEIQKKLAINDNNQQLKINIYPTIIQNNTLNIYCQGFNKNKNIHAWIMDLSGRVLQDISINKKVTAVNLKMLPSGIYFIYIDQHGEISSHKILKIT